MRKKNGRMDQEEEEEEVEQISNMWPCTFRMRVMIFILITQPKLLFVKVSALCSQDRGLKSDLTWHHVCSGFMSQTQMFHCFLELKATAV